MPPDAGNQPTSAFELTAAELRVFALGCLGGCFEASAVCMDAKGVRLIGGGPQRACLLTSPDHLEPLSILHVQRSDPLQNGFLRTRMTQRSRPRLAPTALHQ